MTNTAIKTNIEIAQFIIFEVEKIQETAKAVQVELVYQNPKYDTICASFKQWIPKSAIVGEFEDIAAWMKNNIKAELYKRN